MMRFAWTSLLLAAAIGCGGDDKVERPRLCLLPELPTDASAAAQACRGEAQEGTTSQHFSDGQTFYVLHTLSKHADVHDPVSITVETACPGSATTTELFHQDNALLYPVLAPPGASCSLVVTAQMLNETARVVSVASSTDCKPACPEAAQGGAGSSP